MIALTVLLTSGSAHAAAMPGHMHMQAYNLTWFGMRPSVALMMAMYNQAVDDNIATDAFTAAVAEVHFTQATAAEQGTINLRDLKGLVNQFKSLRTRIMTKGLSLAGTARPYSHLDASLAKRDFKQVASAVHTIVDLTSFHVGFSPIGHAHEWTRPDELNPARIRRMVAVDAALTVLYALLDIDHVMFTAEARERILGGFNLSQKVLDDTIEKLESVLRSAGNTSKLDAAKTQKLREEIIELGVSLRESVDDPAEKLEQAYWEDPNNQKLLEALPIRGTREYFDKFIYPELKRRVNLDHGTIQSIDPQFREKLVSQRFDYYLENIDQIRADAPMNYDASAVDNRDLIPAYLTRDLVEVSMRAELLRDVLVELEVFKRGNIMLKPELADMGKLIVNTIGQQMQNGKLPFSGIVDVVNFDVVNKMVFGNPYGHSISSLQFMLHRARSSPIELFKNQPESEKLYRVGGKKLSYTKWQNVRHAFSLAVIDGHKATNEGDLATAQAKYSDAAKLIADFYIDSLINSGVVLASNQEITQNLLARVAPMPKEWGIHTQIFDNPASDAFTIRREKQIILENYAALAGFKFRYSWNPAKDWREKVISEWKKEKAAAKQLDVEEISDPNLIKKMWLWWIYMDKVPLVNAEEYVLIAPNGIIERMALWMSGMKRLFLAGYGFRATPKGIFPEQGLKASVGNRFRGYAEGISDVWRRSAGMDIGLLTAKEYQKRLEALRQVNAKYAPKSKDPYSAFAKMAERPDGEAVNIPDRGRVSRMCRALFKQ
jgi:hypothetical protein